MQVATSGVLRRVDLTPLLDLVPALRDEWAGLEFGADGRVRNPVTGAAMPEFRLVEGRHRQRGARYSAPYDVPRTEKGVRVGVDHRTVVVVLRDDDARHLAVTCSDESADWAADVDVQHGRLPRVDVSLRIDLTASMVDQGTPRSLARLLGGTLEVHTHVDLTTLDGHGGTFFDADGRMNRSRAAARADVDGTATTWVLTAAMTIRPRGWIRIALWFTGRRLRRYLDEQLRGFWDTADVHVDRAESEIREFADRVAHEGGPAAFVHRALWDRDFDPRPGPTGR